MHLRQKKLGYKSLKLQGWWRVNTLRAENRGCGEWKETCWTIRLGTENRMNICVFLEKDWTWKYQVAGIVLEYLMKYVV